MMKAFILLALAAVTVSAQESTFQEVERIGNIGNFKEALGIREVRESSAKDVAEALSKVDGLWKVRRGGIAADTVLRGFQQDNIAVLVDGVRIYGACPNNMDPPAFHVDFAEIREVEVAKGAFDAKNHGSLGGTVSITNKLPEQGLRLTPTFGAGSFGFFNPSLVGSYASDRVYVAGGHSYRRSEPFRDGAGRRFTELANYRKDARGRDAFNINTGWGKFGIAESVHHRSELAYTRQMGDEVLYPYLQMDAAYDNADRASVTHTYSRSESRMVRLSGYLAKVKHWMTDERRETSVGAARPYGMATFAGTRSAGGRIEAKVSSLTIGAEAHKRNWNTVTTMRMSGMYMDQHSIPNATVLDSGIFAEYTAQLGKFRLTAGSRLDRASSAVHSSTVNTDLFWAYKGTRSLEAVDVEPSANATVAYNLTSRVEVFFGAGRSVRVPDPQERYFGLRRMGNDWVGNPELKPVRNTEADLGLIYRRRRLILRPTLFYSNLDGYITVHNQARMNMVPGIMNAVARSYANVPAIVRGGELSYNVAFNDRLSLFGGGSYSRGTKSVMPGQRITDRDMAEMPPAKLRTALRYGTRLFFAEAEGIAAKRQGHVDSDLFEASSAGYALMNLKVGVHTKKLNLNLGLDNVFDRLVYEAFSYQRDPFRTGARVPEPGRSVFVSLTYAF
jgi:iron complex outermembrane receptor protein